jgi:uncharacterized OB-fold protein
MPMVSAPVSGPDDRFFWDGAKEHRLLLRKCSSCHRLQHPPSPMCPACGSVRWDVQDASGLGTVYSWIVSKHPTLPDAEPRIVALVELAEGVRLVANLCDVEVADVQNDMPVQVSFSEINGTTLPQFRPVPPVAA